MNNDIQLSFCLQSSKFGISLSGKKAISDTYMDHRGNDYV